MGLRVPSSTTLWWALRWAVVVVLMTWTWPVLVALYVLGWVTAPRGTSVKIGARVQDVSRQCPSLHRYAPFPLLALPWLRGHLMTIVPDLCRSVSAAQYDLRGGLVASGDARLGCHYYLGRQRESDTPFVVVFPGLTGGAHDCYVLSMVEALKRELGVRGARRAWARQSRLTIWAAA